MKYAAATSGILATLILLAALKGCEEPTYRDTRRETVTPTIASPGVPPRIPDPAKALMVARIFALDHAQMLFGQIPVGRVSGATARLRAELRAFDIPRTRSKLAASLQITGLQVTPTGVRTATATATLTAPGQKPWPAVFELRHQAGDWQVTRINEAQ